MKSGVILACFIDDYEEEEPQLGMVTEEPTESSEYVEVEWMTGSYNKRWKVWKDRNGTWKEKISLRSTFNIISFDSTGKLSTDTVDKLKQTYEKLRNA